MNASVPPVQSSCSSVLSSSFSRALLLGWFNPSIITWGDRQAERCTEGVCCCSCENWYEHCFASRGLALHNSSLFKNPQRIWLKAKRTTWRFKASYSPMTSWRDTPLKTPTILYSLKHFKLWRLHDRLNLVERANQSFSGASILVCLSRWSSENDWLFLCYFTICSYWVCSDVCSSSLVALDIF